MKTGWRYVKKIENLVKSISAFPDTVKGHVPQCS